MDIDDRIPACACANFDQLTCLSVSSPISGAPQSIEVERFRLEAMLCIWSCRNLRIWSCLNLGGVGRGLQDFFTSVGHTIVTLSWEYVLSKNLEYIHPFKI